MEVDLSIQKFNNLFGSSFISFDDRKIREMMESNNNEKIIELQNYILKYWAHCPRRNIVFFWDADKKIVEILTIENAIKKTFNSQFRINNFYLKNWFFAKCVDCLFEPTFNINKPRIFIDDNGIHRLNMFGGTRYTYDPSKNNKLEDLTFQKNLDILLNYIKSIVCTNDDNTYKFVLDWIIRAINLNKMSTYLCLCGDHDGSNKLIPNLLCECLGSIATFRNIDTKYLLDKSFTSCINGKVLVVMKHTHSAQNKEKKIIQTLKNIVHDNEIEICNRSNFRIENNINYILVSENKFHKYNIEDKNAVILNISNDKMNDYEYYNMLEKICKCNEFIECFYYWCLQRNNTSTTQYMKILPINELHKPDKNIVDPLIIFIKNYYLLNRQSVNVLYKYFFNTYMSWIKSTGYVINCGKNVISRKLKNININWFVSGTGNKNYVHIPWYEMYKYFFYKKLITNIDIEKILSEDIDANVFINDENVKNNNLSIITCKEIIDSLKYKMLSSEKQKLERDIINDVKRLIPDFEPKTIEQITREYNKQIKIVDEYIESCRSNNDHCKKNIHKKFMDYYKNKTYREKHLKKLKKKVKCDICGSITSAINRYAHIKSKKHIACVKDNKIKKLEKILVDLLD